MTCIAFDGKTLAADKLVCFGPTKGTVTKIFRHGSELLAVAGNLSIGMETMQWYRDGAAPSAYPAANRNTGDGASLIVIKPDSTVLKYESSPFPFKLEGPFAAFGSGDESAMIAMECGADARRAVELASKYNTGCGNGIDTLELEP